MLAQVVVTSVILEGGRLLGFSSMLKYTLERYYFAQWKEEVTGIHFWVVVYKWGHFQAFLAVALQRRECPTEGLILFILVSFTAAQARVMQYSPSPRSCYLQHENESCTMIGCSLEKGCMSIWTSCVGTGSIVWLWPVQMWRRLFYIGIIFQIIVSIHWRKTLTNDTPLDKSIPPE